MQLFAPQWFYQCSLFNMPASSGVQTCNKEAWLARLLPFFFVNQIHSRRSHAAEICCYQYTTGPWLAKEEGPSYSCVGPNYYHLCSS